MKSIFVVVLLIGLSACAVNKATNDKGKTTQEEAKSEPTLVGDWKLFDFDLGMEIPEEQMEMYNTMKQEMIDNSTMSYKADGTYSQYDILQGEAKTRKGTYSIEEDKVTTISSEGVKTTVNIDSLTEDDVTFSMEDRGNTMTMTYKRK